MQIVFRDGRNIGEDAPPYIVAEVNSSHNGSLEVAKQMIDAAVDAGCDCVKFQSFTEDSLYSKDYYQQNPIAKRFVSKFSFGEDKLKACADYCKKRGIAFASTPYSKQEVDFLAEQCDVPFIKIASMEVNNLPFLEYIAKKQLPIVMSTGMAAIDEIRAAVKTIEQAGNTDMVLLHCVSIYPVDVSDVNLNNMKLLMETFPYPAGYSDHTLGVEIASAAVTMGASLIEKHLTLDRTKIGMDNQMATQPDDMALMVKYCHNVHSALGEADRKVSDAELQQRKNMRRSLIYTRDLPAGTVLTDADIDAKRPGTGFEPGRRADFIGRKLTKDAYGDTLLAADDFT